MASRDAPVARSRSGQGAAAPGDPPIYLDHAAATPLHPEVAAAMQEASESGYANPSSPHAAGRQAKQLLEDAREEILELLGGRSSGPARERLIFTSGATEANRLGVLGTAGDQPGWIGVSARDHASIRGAADQLARIGWQVAEVPLSAGGSLDPARLAEASAAAGQLRRILTVTTTCGQTGIRDDLAAVDLVRADQASREGSGGLLLHADLTQQAGWEPIGFHNSAFTSAALAPCKFGGPRGIGAVVIRHGIRVVPLAPGPQELGLRGGTEAVSLAVGFARALRIAAAGREAARARLATLRQRLEAGLLAAAAAAGIEAIVVGRDSDRAAHVVMLALADTDRQAVAMAADLAGVCLATGTACASGSSEPPAVLAALGLPERFHRGGVRLSLAATTTADLVDEAIVRLGRVFSRLAHSGLFRS